MNTLVGIFGNTGSMSMASVIMGVVKGEFSVSVNDQKAIEKGLAMGNKLRTKLRG